MWHPGEQQFITIEGVMLETRCWGPTPDEAATLVLLHEGLGSVQLWREFPQKLATVTGLGVFAFSRQGYGQSDLRTTKRAIDFMSVEALDVLPKVLDAIGFQRGMLIGHSDGASISAIHAGQVNDPRIDGIVLMAPHFFIEDISIASIRMARKTFDETDLAKKMSRYHRDPAHTFNGWCNAWLRPEFATWDITNVLPGIKVPVLAIQGQDDQYGTPAQIDVISHRVNGPVESHLLPDCRHAPFAEQESVVLDLVGKFVKGNRPAK